MSGIFERLDYISDVLRKNNATLFDKLIFWGRFFVRYILGGLVVATIGSITVALIAHGLLLLIGINNDWVADFVFVVVMLFLLHGMIDLMAMRAYEAAKSINNDGGL